MLINVRGTCGSGKSHIVHTIRNSRNMRAFYQLGRKRPAGYTDDGLMIPGHYEIAIGGIDTFRTLDDAYDVVNGMFLDRHVLCEGKAQNDDVEHVMRAGRLRALVVLNLVTDPDTCIASVRARGHNISEAIIRRTHKKCGRDAARFRAAGMDVRNVSRDEALSIVRGLLS